MKIITTIAEMRSLSGSHRMQGKKLGFVPTMGFLHEGHLSLMGRARQENDIVVASIFVNPTQFGPKEDLDRYPRDAAGDQAKCETSGVDVLFMPQVSEMYPEKPDVFVAVEGVSEVLEGALRPGHFRGVATVVAKLFNIIQPHRAYFGQKDFQQCVVIKRMVAGLNLDVEVAVLPTVREQDGLAMSSRNSYLSAEERRVASTIWRALSEGERLFRIGQRDAVALQGAVRSILLQQPGISVDYVEIVDPDGLRSKAVVEDRTLILVAVRVGRTRLIDNLQFL
ncbi:MAG: pantoate--beta-alanine ligase [Nitrospirae bacterium GWC2_56_14]|nr:MAG: pantoate--beta-alanine ligase [Nitrospirae bacterium GWC2_56_14]